MPGVWDLIVCDGLQARSKTGGRRPKDMEDYGVKVETTVLSDFAVPPSLFGPPVNVDMVIGKKGYAGGRKTARNQSNSKERMNSGKIKIKPMIE